MTRDQEIEQLCLDVAFLRLQVKNLELDKSDARELRRLLMTLTQAIALLSGALVANTAATQQILAALQSANGTADVSGQVQPLLDGFNANTKAMTDFLATLQQSAGTGTTTTTTGAGATTTTSTTTSATDTSGTAAASATDGSGTTAADTTTSTDTSDAAAVNPHAVT